jgi:hypothetical protein
MFLHEKIRVVGIGLFLAGSLCLPLVRTNPKSALSLFEMLAELGFLWKLGLGTMILGALIFVVSFFVKR